MVRVTLGVSAGLWLVWLQPGMVGLTRTVELTLRLMHLLMTLQLLL